MLAMIKTITVLDYPANFSFKIRTNLPPIKMSRSASVIENCDVRNKLLHRHMREQNIYSPCHMWTDYVVEDVETTKDGEIWQLGS
jgi:hypothetical protein